MNAPAAAALLYDTWPLWLGGLVLVAAAVTETMRDLVREIKRRRKP